VKNGILSLTSAAADFADARRFFPFILFCGNPRHLRIKEAKDCEVHNFPFHKKTGDGSSKTKMLPRIYPENRSSTTDGHG
jgi:hypothetical protein